MSQDASAAHYTAVSQCDDGDGGVPDYRAAVQGGGGGVKGVAASSSVSSDYEPPRRFVLVLLLLAVLFAASAVLLVMGASASPSASPSASSSPSPAAAEAAAAAACGPGHRPTVSSVPSGLSEPDSVPAGYDGAAASDSDSVGDGEVDRDRAAAALPTQSPSSASSLPACGPPVLLSALPASRRRPPSPPGCRGPETYNGSVAYPRGVNRIHTFLISFPRSGNTMTRKILEDGTGVITGTPYMDSGLAMSGMRGEGQVRDVLLLKHHFLRVWPPIGLELAPLYDPLTGTGGKYAVERFIYAVRHPMDALVSLFMNLELKSRGDLNSHSAVVELQLHSLIPHIMTWLPVWARHVSYFTAEFLRDRCLHCDVLVVRYEDFVLHPDRSSPLNPTGRMLCFLGFPLQRQDCRLPDQLPNATVTYELKTRRSLLNSSRSVPHDASYSDEIFAVLSREQVAFVHKVAGLEMRAFGYWPSSIDWL